MENSDIVIVTGGLGPTHDDITRSCVVKFFDTELVENEEVLEKLNYTTSGYIVMRGT